MVVSLQRHEKSHANRDDDNARQSDNQDLAQCRSAGLGNRLRSILSNFSIILGGAQLIGVSVHMNEEYGEWTS